MSIGIDTIILSINHFWNHFINAFISYCFIMVKGYKYFQTKFHTVFFFQLQQSDILQVCIQSSLLMQYAFSHSLIKVHSLVY